MYTGRNFGFNVAGEVATLAADPLVVLGNGVPTGAGSLASPVSGFGECVCGKIVVGRLTVSGAAIGAGIPIGDTVVATIFILTLFGE